jgi:hypothetical protein
VLRIWKKKGRQQHRVKVRVTGRKEKGAQPKNIGFIEFILDSFIVRLHLKSLDNLLQL